MRRSFLLAPCLLAGLVFGLGALVAPAEAGWWDDLDRGQSVELADLVAKPSLYQGRDLSFFCIYHRVDEVFAPLAAPYRPDTHANIAVWKDGAPIWDKAAYQEDYPFLYLARSHPQQAQLLSLEPFTRIEVTGRLHGAIRARPCIEIRSFRITGHRVGRTVVQSVMRGDRFSEAGELDLAYENYRRALTPDLPPVYDLPVRKRLAAALRRLGRSDEAMAIEGGPILGGGTAPDEVIVPGGRLGDPLPGMPGSSTPGRSAPPPISADLPGTPSARSPIARDLPGTPARETPAIPGPSPSLPLPSAVPPSPSALPPVTVDLPGVPAQPPAPVARDLPGAPIDAAPAPPPIRREDLSPEPAPSPVGVRTPAVAPAPPPLPASPPLPAGAPPRRTPRLAGVK